VRRAIASISEDAWTTICYPRAVWDERLEQWVSDAQIAEIEFTAFASRGKRQAGTARLIVRRVRDANPDHVANEQGKLFPAWRHRGPRPGQGPARVSAPDTADHDRRRDTATLGASST
jgi:hypothetical protein